MQPRHQASHRLRSQGSNKRAVVGSTAGTVPPAWRTTMAQIRPALHEPQKRDLEAGQPSQSHSKRQPRPAVGSKILMSQLPLETVHERDIEELFAETIGPVFDVFIVYNSSGRSKGMAVVHFQRSGDAAEARRRYNGKIIDGRRPLKIELITDPPEAPPVKMKTLSLAERLGGPLVNGNSADTTRSNLTPHVSALNGPKARPQTQRRKFKKGPRRLKKSVEQLDREMEVYMTAASRFVETDIKMAMDPGGTVLV